MRVLELSLRNYRVFEEVDLELPARVIGIFGENGAGKSALVESIGFALYGVDAARTKKHGIRTQGVLTDCVVRMVFEHGGQPYEVRRTLKGKGSMPEAELFAGELLLASGTTEVDAEVRRLLHMDLHVFRASVFAEQKQLDAFSEVGPAKRKEMALRLLGIKPVDDARTIARKEARRVTEHVGELAETVADIAELEAEVKGAKGAAADARAIAKRAAAELKGATARAKAGRHAFERIDADRQRVEKLTVTLQARTEQRAGAMERRDGLVGRVEQLAAELEELPALQKELQGLAGATDRLHAAERAAETADQLGRVEAELAKLPEPDAEGARTELELARAEHTAAQAAAATATARLSHERSLLAEAEELLVRASDADPSQPCPTCGRPLGEDFVGYLRHCKQEVSSARSRAREAERTAKESSSALAKAEAAWRAADAAEARVRAATDARAQLAAKVEDLRAALQALEAPFAGSVPDVAVLREQAVRAAEVERRLAGLAADRKHLERAEKDLEAAERAVAELERVLEELAEQAEAVAFDPAEHARLRAERDAAEEALDAARVAEREAADALTDAQRTVAGLEGELKRARETAAAVDALASEARHVERVAILLDGFRDHLVSRIGPDLSREAEALFRELTNHEYDDLKIDEETLTVQIADGESYHPIERFSGSETDLANLALRVAISTHLSRMSGADVGMMVLDEVLASLDEERKDLMVQTLGRLAGRFHQLFVITHAERVKDQFPATIQVSKTGRRRSVAALV